MRIVDPLALGTWVRENRDLLKLTQEQLAASAGITRFQLIRIESGKSKTSRETACSLAMALDKPEGEALRLAGYDGEPLPTLEMRLAREIEPYLMRLAPERRLSAERFLLEQAKSISELLTA